MERMSTSQTPQLRVRRVGLDGVITTIAGSGKKARQVAGQTAAGNRRHGCGADHTIGRAGLRWMPRASSTSSTTDASRACRTGPHEVSEDSVGKTLALARGRSAGMRRAILDHADVAQADQAGPHGVPEWVLKTSPTVKRPSSPAPGTVGGEER